MRDDLKLMLPQGCRLAIKHMAIRIYHRCHIESLFHAAFDFYRRNARRSKVVKMRKHVQILGIQQIRAAIALFYAEALVDSGIDFDLLFGPAYKGIPIATTTAVALAEHHDRDVPYCFNRKEAKTHGEGGNLVGSALQGRVMLVDDVITAGTAIRESMEIIQANGATLAGVLISLDRQERGRGDISAIQEVERDYGCKVISIITLTDLIAYLEEKPEMADHLAAVKAYREEFGV